MHGIKGELKILPWCDNPQLLTTLDTLYFDNGDKSIKIDSSRVQKNMVIMKLHGIDTPEDAIKIRNKVIFINRADIVLDKDTYFIADLIGIKVIDADTGDEYGIIEDVSQTGANDVYHIKSNKGMYYIPAIPDVIINTDIIANTMTIRPLKGLFDDED